jgi:hypothetical protein
VAHLSGSFSEEVFDTLAEWNDILKPQEYEFRNLLDRPSAPKGPRP